ncbi:tetratricopeptide repeat protein [Streptomyces buecherae]|uniref:tetratricopeptide repeat protein n=1 Tax=Streptomyces buecherae TaxID=2763006 RepID=UPI00364F8BA6
MPPSGPNTELEKIFQETGWTLRQFAQAVNRAATEAGAPTRYREPSIHQWLKGHLPVQRVRPLVLEALSRKLGRAISLADAGFPALPAEAGSTTHEDLVGDLIALGRQDMDPSRRTILSASVFSATFAVPSWAEAIERRSLVTSDKSIRIGTSDVTLVRSMIKNFSQLDDVMGGKVTRPSAAAFLVNNVAPLLHAPAKESVRSDLLSAASEFCYLLGYMAVDEGAHALAQRYYSKALELAGGAGDPSLYCLTLHGMSSQAVNSGQAPTALRLANAAAGPAREVSVNMRVHLYAQQAYSAAAAHHKAEAFSLLRQAENSLSKAEPESGKSVVGLASPGLLAYYRAQVEYSLGNVSRSVTEMHEALKPLRGQGRLRRRVLDTGRLADRQCQSGLLEEACATWGLALTEYPHVRSGRCDEQMRVMFARLRPYLRNPHARALFERARDVVPSHVAPR